MDIKENMNMIDSATVAERLGISSKTAVRLMKGGEIAEVVRVGRQYRTTEAAFADYIKRNTLQHPSATEQAVDNG